VLQAEKLQESEIQNLILRKKLLKIDVSAETHMLNAKNSIMTDVTWESNAEIAEISEMVQILTEKLELSEFEKRDMRLMRDRELSLLKENAFKLADEKGEILHDLSRIEEDQKTALAFKDTEILSAERSAEMWRNSLRNREDCIEEMSLKKEEVVSELNKLKQLYRELDEGTEDWKGLSQKNMALEEELSVERKEHEESVEYLTIKIEDLNQSHTEIVETKNVEIRDLIDQITVMINDKSDTMGSWGIDVARLTEELSALKEDKECIERDLKGALDSMSMAWDQDVKEGKNERLKLESSLEERDEMLEVLKALNVKDLKAL